VDFFIFFIKLKYAHTLEKTYIHETSTVKMALVIGSQVKKYTKRWGLSSFSRDRGLAA
jgi:hypothetical protein